MDTNDNQRMTVKLAAQKITRRRVLAGGALAGGAMLLRAHAADQQPEPKPDKDFKFKETNPARENTPPKEEHFPPGEPGKDYTPAVVPNGWTLPYKVIGGVKVFQFVVEDVEHEFAQGLKA